MRVFSCQSIARLRPYRDTRPCHSYSRRSPGLPAGRETRHWRLDCRDPHEAAALLRDDAVPAPSGTHPAPQVSRTDDASPTPPLAAQTRPTALTQTTSPQPSPPNCYRLPTRAQASPRHTGARAGSARPPRRGDSPWYQDRAAWDPAPPPQPGASTVSPSLVPRRPPRPGVAATAIPVTRGVRTRRASCHPGTCWHGDHACFLAVQVGIKPTAPHLQDLTAHRDWPDVFGLGHKGRPSLDSLPKQRMAFFHMSRSIRHRLPSSRSWRRASWAGGRGPLPGKAAGG
jgi:hypothetical protein